ncbi:hypothetical protein [Nitrosomonas nitrosa]|uniref:hypothetical protein n=1 Tax=Nitrosomonas nitrosa TaxID=52442 RepID=UPI0023F6ABE7|nr:hypothetical protein [Nitrosomonas nitrosa]MCO6435108.1 hypothetical protein [Nitrosomonas nitrosa]
MANAAKNKHLQELILDDQGIKNIHFFNGRILTAEDLKTEQNTNRQQREQLGQAIGTGIVNGLKVDLVADGSDGSPPVVAVKAGLALNRKGQAVALSADVELALARQQEPLPVEAGLFGECSPPKTGAIPRDRGAYILIATPTSGFRELAPARGFSDGKVISCNSRYAVEGVKFRLEELKITELTKLSQATRKEILELMTKSDMASLSKLRNWLAHICFGTEEMNEFLRDPFARIGSKSPYTSYGAINALHASGQLTDCDMPLALLYWTPTGIQFLDMWSVRRPLTPVGEKNAFASLIDEHRLAVRQAMLQQFQDQIADLAPPNSTLGTKTAQIYFRYLPSVGIIPLAEETRISDAQATRFFNGMTYRSPVFVNATRLEKLLRESLGYPPIDIQSGEMVWLYRVREYKMAIDFANSDTLSQLYLVFASGHLSYIGDAQYDLAHWNYGNYAI